jgi:hypothetical protein
MIPTNVNAVVVIKCATRSISYPARANMRWGKHGEPDLNEYLGERSCAIHRHGAHRHGAVGTARKFSALVQFEF